MNYIQFDELMEWNGPFYFRQNMYGNTLAKKIESIENDGEKLVRSFARSSLARLCFENQFFHTNSVLYFKAHNKFWDGFYNLKV